MSPQLQLVEAGLHYIDQLVDVLVVPGRFHGCRLRGDSRDLTVAARSSWQVFRALYTGTGPGAPCHEDRGRVAQTPGSSLPRCLASPNQLHACGVMDKHCVVTAPSEPPPPPRRFGSCVALSVTFFVETLNGCHG